MSETEPRKEKDFWDKIVAWAKFMGGLGAVIGAVLIPWILQSQSEKNQKVQVYAEIMSQREAGDTEIRAKMFDSLLLKYLTISSNDNNSDPANSYNQINASDENKLKSRKDQIKTFKEKIVFLSILMENFQEYFNARSLFEDLYEEIDDAENAEKVSFKKNTDNSTKKSGNEENNSSEYNEMKNKLTKLSRRNASKQIGMLSRVGLLTDRIFIKEGCISNTIPLFIPDKKPQRKRPFASYAWRNRSSTCCGRIEDKLEAIGELGYNDCSEERSAEEERNNEYSTEEGGNKEECVEDNCEWWNHPDNVTLTKNRYSVFSFSSVKKEKKFHAIKIRVIEIDYPQVEVEVNLYEYKLDARREPKMSLISKRPYKFSVSYFDMPYMDNTRLVDGERFALVLKSICPKDSEEPDCTLSSSEELEALKKELEALKQFDEFLKKIQAEVEEKADFNNPNEFIDSDTIKAISSDKIAAFYNNLSKLFSKFNKDNKSENDASNEEAKKKLKDELQELKEDIEFEIDVTSDSVEHYAVFQVVTFKEEFMSLRDRPLFEEMLNKLHAN